MPHYLEELIFDINTEAHSRLKLHGKGSLKGVQVIECVGNFCVVRIASLLLGRSINFVTHVYICETDIFKHSSLSYIFL